MSTTTALSRQEVAEAYQRLNQLVYRRCRTILRSDAEAKDAMQETFIRLMRYGGESFRNAESPQGFIYRMAERVCFDRLKKRHEATSDRMLFATDAEATLHDRDLARLYLDGLEPRLRDVALMHFVDDMTQDEIAANTGWSRRTVGKKLSLLRDRGARYFARLVAGVLLFALSWQAADQQRWRGDAISWRLQRDGELSTLHQGAALRVGDRIGVATPFAGPVRAQVRDLTSGSLLFTIEDLRSRSLVMTEPCTPVEVQLIDDQGKPRTEALRLECE